MNASKLLELVLASSAGALFGWGMSGERSNAVQAPERTAAASELGPGRWRSARESDSIRPYNAPDEREMDMLRGMGYLDGYEEVGSRSGVTVHDAERASSGWNFVTSGHAAECTLLDMQGREMHRWSQPPEEIWPDYFADDSPNTRSKRFFRRAMLFPNGDVVGIFCGLGLVRIDSASNLLWARRGGFHHDLSVDPEGNLWVLDREKGARPQINADVVVVLTPGGEELRRFSLLECFERSDYRGVMDFMPEVADVFHTNTLQILDGSLADLSPHYAAGNLLISMRHTNTVAIVDPTSERAVWALSGNWRRQHEPTLLPSGNLLLLDNMSIDDHSRVVELDPCSQTVVWELTGSPELPFYTRTCGVVQRLPNGNTLITESDFGRAFEVTPDKMLVWEWISPYRAGERDELVATLFELERLPADFPVGNLIH